MVRIRGLKDFKRSKNSDNSIELLGLGLRFGLELRLGLELGIWLELGI
jgi:hypothetical protein